MLIIQVPVDVFWTEPENKTRLSQWCVSSDICPDLKIRLGLLTSQIADDLLNIKGMKNPSGSALFISGSDPGAPLRSCAALCILLHQNKLRCNNAHAANTLS